MNSNHNMILTDEYPDDKEGISQGKAGEVHRGQIVELTVKHCAVSISDIARKLQISRRTLYNWFETRNLDFDIIWRIGCVIEHDFRKEFPRELAARTTFFNNGKIAQPHEATNDLGNSVYYWMDRYIKLLEKYNEKLMSVK